MNYYVNNAQRKIEPIHEQQVEESSHALLKKQSHSSDFSQFQKPDNIPQRRCTTQNQQQLSPYLKPLIDKKEASVFPFKTVKNKESYKNGKLSKTKKHKSIKIKSKSMANMAERKQGRQCKQRQQGKLNKIFSNKYIGSNCRIFQAQPQRNKSLTTVNKKDSQSNINKRKTSHKSLNGQISEKAKNTSYKYKSNPKLIIQNKKHSIQEQYKSSQSLIREHKKSQFSHSIKDCILKTMHIKQNRNNEQPDTLKQTKQNKKQIQKDFKQTKGGLCFDIDTKQFPCNKINVVQINKLQQKNRQKYLKRINKINSKEEILRRRQMAYNYGQIIRKRTFGCF